MADKSQLITTDDNTGAKKKLQDIGGGYHAEVVVAQLLGGVPGGPAVDRELVITFYRVKTAFTGAAVGDMVSATRVLDLAADPAVQVGATLWYNETQQAALASTPAAANIEPQAATGLTAAQLSAAALATAAKQDLLQTAIDALNAKTPAAGAAQPISAANLPLPTGAATSALQTAGNTLLANIPVKGTSTAANSMPVTPASDANVARESYGSAPIWNLNTPVTAATYTALPAQLCNNVMLVNPSTVDLEFQIAGTGGRMPLLAGTGYLVPGVTNANQIGVRRRDAAAAAQVAVEFAAQAFVL